MEKPEIKLEDLIRLAEISASSKVEYVRAEEVRKNLVKFGFELWEEEESAEPTVTVKPDTSGSKEVK
jgi:hypothetical protein